MHKSAPGACMIMVVTWAEQRNGEPVSRAPFCSTARQFATNAVERPSVRISARTASIAAGAARPAPARGSNNKEAHHTGTAKRVTLAEVWIPISKTWAHAAICRVKIRTNRLMSLFPKSARRSRTSRNRSSVTARLPKPMPAESRG